MSKNRRRNTNSRRHADRLHEAVLPGFFRDFPEAFDEEEESYYRLPPEPIGRIPAVYRDPSDWDNLLFNKRYRFPDDDQLTDYLGTGGLIKTPEEARILASRGYTHVINTATELRDEGPRVVGAGMEYFDNPSRDDYQWKEPEWFLRTLDYAIPVIAQGGKVYVHCLEGVNRGPSNAYAVLRVMGYSRKDAMALIKAKRSRAKARYALEAEEAVEMYRAAHV